MLSCNTFPKSIGWHFPANSTHDGIPLGNGLFGALLWGQNHALHITINRQDYWDHRGGIEFGKETTYENLCQWLRAEDEASLRGAFEGITPPLGQPNRPTHLPMGRLDFSFQLGEIEDGCLSLSTGEAVIRLNSARPIVVRAIMPRGQALLALRIEGLSIENLVLTSAPPNTPEVLDHWQAYGLEIPKSLDEGDSGGWVQPLPADPALAVRWYCGHHNNGIEIYLVAERGETREQAWTLAKETLTNAKRLGYAALADGEATWWRNYWQQTAKVSIPDNTLQELYDLGLYKLAGMSLPGTPPACLQGPWIEEYRMPPWSADYHFNINVQECYWPAFGGNHLETLQPLWEMLETWMPRLRENARRVYDIEDGLMLPHAVDDRCTCMGGFWTGSIDHGSTSWMAQMMWMYYQYTGDTSFLKRLAYPFMYGAMRVYEVMLKEKEGRYYLPISVSPEYGGAAMWAWGANASFQLAIIHCLCRALIQAVKVLKLDVDTSRWKAIDQGLPTGSILTGEHGPELQLWDDQPLAMSHRHHSHLASLYPFDTVDPWRNDTDRELIENSFNTWVRMGMGNWSGWCLPWASILWARMHNGDRAALLLEEMSRAFRTSGKATTHDAIFKGFTTLANNPDIMQMDATMGAATAVLEMLLHTAGGITRVFPAIPQGWDNVRFDGIRIPGAFLVSAESSNGTTRWVEVTSECGGTLMLENPFAPQNAALSARDRITTLEEDEGIIKLAFEKGNTILLVPESTRELGVQDER